jgi:hypothetical protein
MTAHDKPDPAAADTPPLLGTHWVWKAALAGLASISVAAVIGLATGDPISIDAAETASANKALDAIRVLITFAGAFAVGVSVSCLPRDPRLLAIAAASCFAGYFAFPAHWDSGRMVAIFGTAVATIACLLMWMPQRYRRWGVSLLVLLHFGGIVTAVTGPGAQPWLSAQFSARIYRPYLQFIYMTNAYHFYSPEPGPAHVIWFCIYYENGDTRWVKMPRRPDDIADPLAVSYYRRLSLSEQLHALAANRNPPDEVMRARLLRMQGSNGIPMHPELPMIEQYRPLPENYREHLLPGFVRHVASQKLYQHTDPNIAIKSIRVYYVEHFILTPDKVEAGFGFYDDVTYLPFYFGNHSKDGELLDTNDPLLYWLLPIVYFPKEGRVVPPNHNWKTHPDEFELKDAVVKHSGSDHKAE